MGCYVRGEKMAWDVMSGVTKTAWDVLSGVANLCGMFCMGCKKMAWDVLSRDVLSGSHVFLIECDHQEFACIFIHSHCLPFLSIKLADFIIPLKLISSLY